MSDIERDPEPPTFADLDIDDRVLKALSDVGYESPSPIQAATIPPLLEGKDVVGLAQTGTGKTAAFAVPVLSRIDTSIKQTQALVLAPTRELALQVAEPSASTPRTSPPDSTSCRSTVARATASSCPDCAAVRTSSSVRLVVSSTISKRAPWI